MVKEDDSAIKEASDTIPALRNLEDQRSMQSRRQGKAGVYLGRFQGMALPRILGWSYTLEILICRHIKN